jgi:protein-tyrosine-phosphatase
VPVRVLFVCCGNTCRSVFAQFLTNARVSGVRAESAGLRPQPAADAKNAIDTLRVQFGIDASGHVPRAIASVDLSEYDYFVALDREAFEAVQRMGIAEERLVLWKTHDPWGGDSAKYDACALQVVRHVSALRKSVRNKL